jgi:uncharacterized protein (DUF2225 family)/CRP-like cAMP-binding protein
MLLAQSPERSSIPHRREPLTPALNRIRALSTLAAGATLCRENDPPGQAYLVISGTLRVFRRDRKNPQQNEDLAELGPGALVGELSAMLNQPRTATVQAITPVQLLPIPIEQLRTMAQTHPSLLRVLILALQDRAGLSPAQISGVAARQGVDLSAVEGFLDECTADRQADDEGPAFLPAPPHDAALIDTRRVSCPACGTRFTALVYRSHMMRPTESESDFHQRFSTPINPYDYEVWVCPQDLYAAFQSDFAELAERDRSRVGEVVDRLVTTEWAGQRPDFGVERNIGLRERSLELALGFYRLRGAPAARVASVLHRLAWCARERDDAEAEQRWLREAFAAYEEGYTQAELNDPKEDVRLQYLCGELARRADDHSTAVKWFQHVLSHPAIKEFPMWERLARQQWSQLRER